MSPRLASVAVLLSVSLFSTSGCGDRGGGPGGSTLIVELKNRFEQAVISEGHLTFRTFGGRPVTTEGSVEVTFFPDGTVNAKFDGGRLEGYDGSYRIDNSGVVTVEQSGPRLSPMQLDEDKRSIFLLPIDIEPGLTHAIINSQVDERSEGMSWPLRPAKDAQNRSVNIGPPAP